MDYLEALSVTSISNAQLWLLTGTVKKMQIAVAADADWEWEKKEVMRKLRKEQAKSESLKAE